MRHERASDLRVIILGSAAGGGFPQWNCNCANCAAHWAGDPAFPARSQSSIAVTATGDEWALINASPDLRAQILATPQLQPRRGKRDSPIRSVLLTNGDLDHIAGLLNLREQHSFDLLATAELHGVLRANPVFDALSETWTPRREIAIDSPFELAPGVQAILFAAPGKAPLFLEKNFMDADGAIDTELESGFTVGVEIRADGRRFHYVPGCARVTATLAERLRGADLVLFDGTVFHDDDMIRAGVGQKTGARMGHLAMAGPAGSLAAFSDLEVARKIYVHVNNTNPALDPAAPERAAIEAAGWELSYDGMEITL